MTTNIAEVLKLAAKPFQYDNDEDLARVSFQARELPHLGGREVRPTLARRRVSTSGEPPNRRRRNSSDHPNAESHSVRLVGDTDHWTKLETGAKSTEQKRVRGVETVGGRERAEDRGSEIRDAASRATAGDE